MEKTTADIGFELCLRQILNGQRKSHHQPDKEVETGEVVLGTLVNPVAMSMYSLWQEMEEGGEHFLKTAPESIPVEKKEEIKALECRAHQLGNRMECAKHLFWEFVYSEFPKARERGVAVGIRVGWVVVIYKSRSGNSLFEFLTGGGPFA